MEAFTAFFQLLQLGQLLGFLRDYPATGLVFGGMAVVLAFLVNVGPLKRIRADTLVGKAIALSAVAVMLTGLVMLTVSMAARGIRDVAGNGPPRAARENDPAKRPADGERCIRYDGETSACIEWGK